jgi:hypothetical protein
MVAGQKLAFWCMSPRPAPRCGAVPERGAADRGEQGAAALLGRTRRCWPPGRTCSPPGTECKANGDREECEHIADSVTELDAVKLAHVAARWITEHRTGERAREAYLSLWRHHVELYLGQVELAELSTETIQSWRAALLQDVRRTTGRPRRTGWCGRSSNTAVDDGRIKRNPYRPRVLGSIGPASDRLRASGRSMRWPSACRPANEEGPGRHDDPCLQTPRHHHPVRRAERAHRNGDRPLSVAAPQHRVLKVPAYHRLRGAPKILMPLRDARGPMKMHHQPHPPHRHLFSD